MSDQNAAQKDRTPDWDMSPYFLEMDGRAYRTFRHALDSDVKVLLQHVHVLGKIEHGQLPIWVDLLQKLEEITARTGHLSSYLGCMGAADAGNETIQRETAAAKVARAELVKIFVVVRAALKEADEDVFAALLNAPELNDATYFIGRLRKSANWSMEPELEALAADLDATGLSAWGRLYDQVSGTLEFDLAVPGQETRRLPVAMTRSLLEDADPTVRKAALVGANRAWEQTSSVTAACLNAIAGTRLTLYKRRGIQHFLEPALFDSGISQKTLDTILAVTAARKAVAQDYLQRKAQLLGREKLGFQDLMAPLPLAHSERVNWAEARTRVLAAFESFYPDLARFAKMAFDQDWIDYSPRIGKRPGGFCSTSSIIGQSRIFMTYNETVGDISTLAHELGHAFHGWLMRDMRPWSRRYPLTLAETASTFAEQLLIDAVLTNPTATPAQRALVLDSRMQAGVVFLLNIPMRFSFEKAVYEERAQDELSVSRLKALMQEAQQEWYGDSLAQDELDPWFWASKLHFYITDVSFYNFPYTFGYLFSMGIFALAKKEGPAFLPRYEALLRLTGSDTAQKIAKMSLGVDLEAPDFWNASIDLIENDWALFQTETNDPFDKGVQRRTRETSERS